MSKSGKMVGLVVRPVGRLGLMSVGRQEVRKGGIGKYLYR